MANKGMAWTFSNPAIENVGARVLKLRRAWVEKAEVDHTRAVVLVTLGEVLKIIDEEDRRAGGHNPRLARPLERS